MNTPDELDQWLAHVAQTLGVSTQGVDNEELLSVAKEVAHNQIRPGAPTSTFYLGYALGLWEAHIRAEGHEPTPAQKTAQLKVLSENIRLLATKDTSS